MSEQVSIQINDREYQAPAGARLIEVIEELTGEQVPRFCFHRDLPVVGSCRMCQVEVEAMGPGGAPRRFLAISCRTPVQEGMMGWTRSPAAEKARRGVLEFLLKDHPLDCPICDKAGECPLQNYTWQEGQSEGRSHDPRRKRRKRVSLGEVIVLDQERCVLCSRCVRFFPAVEGRSQLTVLEMGNRSCIGTFDGRPLEGNYQGNLADICPVGALTLQRFRFQARVWNTRPVPSTCMHCSRGCAIFVDEYRDRVVRIRPRHDAEVNRSWICDRGRFAFDDLNLPGRLGTALEHRGGQVQDLGVEEGARRAAAWLAAGGREAVLLASPYLTVEEGEAFRELAADLGTPPRVVLPEVGEGDGILLTGDLVPNRRGLLEAGLEAVAPAEARALLAGAPAALLAGEKLLHVLHGVDPVEPTPELPALELPEHSVLLDTHLRDGFGLCLPARTWVEKQGHVVNEQGLRRRLRLVLSPPPGCREDRETLAAIRAALASHLEPVAAESEQG